MSNHHIALTYAALIERASHVTLTCREITLRSRCWLALHADVRTFQ